MNENVITHQIHTSTSMIGNFMYHGTYETYIGELLRCVEPSKREDCENEIAEIYLSVLTDVINDNVSDDIKDSFILSYDGMYHPRDYNFETDAIEFYINFSDCFKSYLEKYANDNMESFNKFLHKNFTSRSGFYSYTPNNFDDWYTGFLDDDFRCISVAIWYFLSYECDEHNEAYWFYENIGEAVIEGFVSSEFAVRFKNGYVGYCVCCDADDDGCDRFDAYLFDNDGNVTTAHIFDGYWSYKGSAYAAWYEELEYELTDGHRNVGYKYEEMDIREFHKLYDGKF